MATLRTALTLYDGLSGPAHKMVASIRNVVSQFDELDRDVNKGRNAESIVQMNDKLFKMESIIDSFDTSINQADQAQRNFNNDLLGGTSAASGLWNKIKSIAAGLGAMKGISEIIKLADTMTSTNARLNLIVDDGGSVDALEAKIMASANRARASYQATADAVSKLGVNAADAFANNDELIAFTEQVNKQFTISGTSATEASAAMLQLTQAMASGVLRGDELNSIFEQAPTLIQAIADYLNVPIGKIREMASEGEITADIVKNAMFAAADETDAKFAQMPMTFSQVGTILGNTLLQTFQPAIQLIGQGAQWIYDNWSTLEPIFWGVTAALAAYAIITGISTAATWLANAANRALIVTMLSNPILWIALAIGVLIGIIYKWVQAVGGIKVAWMIACNVMLTAWDNLKIGFYTGVYWVMNLIDKLKYAWSAAGVAVANFMGDMKVNVLTILQNMINGAIDLINNFVGILNKLPGVSIDAVQHVTFAATAAAENNAAKSAREAGLNDLLTEITNNSANRQASLNDMATSAAANVAARQTEIGAAQAAANATDSLGAYDLGNAANATAANTGTTADNTGKSVDIAEDSLEYLCDIAEREAINRFTTAEVTIHQTNENHINSDLDLDGIMDGLANKMVEEVDVSAEGGHN